MSVEFMQKALYTSTTHQQSACRRFGPKLRDLDRPCCAIQCAIHEKLHATSYVWDLSRAGHTFPILLYPIQRQETQARNGLRAVFYTHPLHFCSMSAPTPLFCPDQHVHTGQNSTVHMLCTFLCTPRPGRARPNHRQCKSMSRHLVPEAASAMMRLVPGILCLIAVGKRCATVVAPPYRACTAPGNLPRWLCRTLPFTMNTCSDLVVTHLRMVVTHLRMHMIGCRLMNMSSELTAKCCLLIFRNVNASCGAQLCVCRHVL